MSRVWVRNVAYRTQPSRGVRPLLLCARTVRPRRPWYALRVWEDPRRRDAWASAQHYGEEDAWCARNTNMKALV